MLKSKDRLGITFKNNFKEVLCKGSVPGLSADLQIYTLLLTKKILYSHLHPRVQVIFKIKAHDLFLGSSHIILPVHRTIVKYFCFSWKLEVKLKCHKRCIVTYFIQTIDCCNGPQPADRRPGSQGELKHLTATHIWLITIERIDENAISYQL